MSRSETSWKLIKQRLVNARKFLRRCGQELDEYEQWGFNVEDDLLMELDKYLTASERVINELIGMNTIDMFEAPETEEPDGPEDSDA